jgi:hypothetical protein
LPYGFYQLLRWVVCGVAVASAIQLQKSGHIAWVWALALLALIFNPIFPFHLPKSIWKVMDFGAGILFLVVQGLAWCDEKGEDEKGEGEKGEGEKGEGEKGEGEK